MASKHIIVSSGNDVAPRRWSPHYNLMVSSIFPVSRSIVLILDSNDIFFGSVSSKRSETITIHGSQYTLPFR